ncbi:MAG TPA: TonB-dependent receptor [Chitinophagales bacterium]|nr:TonB-dependent receptor [Chitinophagales bacterium]HRP40222.1 TonB-dependent receptor [Chitinophagales bacterium]
MSFIYRFNENLKFLSVAIIVLLLSNSAMAQVVLQVVDSKEKQGIEDVFVFAKNTENKKEILGFTDLKGNISLNLKGKCKLQLKKLGYQSYEFETELNQNLVIMLEVGETRLKDIVVTGQTNATTSEMAVNTIKTISQKKIQEMGAVNLRDALTNQLNMRLSQDNVLGSSVSINGVSGQNIKILIDGVPIIGRMNGSIDLSQINMNNVEQIEIIEGPMSVIYGSDALGGVINIISKNKIKEKFNYQVNGFYESNGTYNTDGKFAFKHKNIALNISGGRNFFDGYDPNYDWERRSMQWKPKIQYFTDNSLLLSFKQHKHTLSGNFFDEKIYNNGKPSISPYSAYGFDEIYHTRKWSASAFSEVYTKGNNSLQFTNSFSHYKRIKNTYRKDLVSGISEIAPSHTDQDTGVFKLLLLRGVWTNSLLKKFQFQAGYDLNIEFAEGQRLESKTQNIQDYAFYTTIQYSPIEKIKIKAGVRAAYNNRYGAPVVPSFNLKYKIYKTISLRASYAMGFRSPSLKELSLFFVDINHNIKGNPNLKAERSHNAQIEIGYEPSIKDFHFSIRPSFFFNHIYDMIMLATVDQASQLYSYINIEKFQSVGGNLNGGIVHKYFDWQFGVAYTGRYNSISKTEALPKFGWSPEVSSSVSINIPKIYTTIAAFYKYNGAIPGYTTDANGNIFRTTIQSYSMLDISATLRIWHERFIVSAGAKNILNVKNINYNVSNSTAHNLSSNTMSMGMGITGFTSLKINLTNNFSK